LSPALFKSSDFGNYDIAKRNPKLNIKGVQDREDEFENIYREKGTGVSLNVNVFTKYAGPLIY